jgi:hypothetical protein
MFAPKLEPFSLVVKKRGGGERTIPPHKFWINRNTPVGEDAEIWEHMPHDGKRFIRWSDVIRKEWTTPTSEDNNA